VKFYNILVWGWEKGLERWGLIGRYESVYRNWEAICKVPLPIYLSTYFYFNLYLHSASCNIFQIWKMSICRSTFSLKRSCSLYMLSRVVGPLIYFQVSLRCLSNRFSSSLSYMYWYSQLKSLKSLLYKNGVASEYINLLFSGVQDRFNNCPIQRFGMNFSKNRTKTKNY